MLNKLKAEFLIARKARDELRVSVLSYLLSEIHNKEIDLRGKGEDLVDDDIKKVIENQIKSRTDSIESYEAGGRSDLVEKEGSEREILEEVLHEYFL